MPTATLLPPARLSRELRTDASADMRRRRWMIGLSFAGAAIGEIVALYQTGIVKTLPDILPGKVFDAEQVDASDYAYSRAQSPDGPLMVINYATTAALASAGGASRAVENPALPIATAAKAAIDTVTALKLAQEEWRDNKALCSWCQIATVISIATLALSLPEAAKAVRGAAA